jgi:hypothetical protein
MEHELKVVVDLDQHHSADDFRTDVNDSGQNCFDRLA